MEAAVIVDPAGNDDQRHQQEITGLREEGGAITLSRVLTLVISLHSDDLLDRLHRGGQLREPRTPVPCDRGGPG